MRTNWLSAFVISTFVSMWLFFALEDPNSWAGMGTLVVAWVFLSKALNELKKIKA